MITITPLNNPEGVTQQEYNSSQEALIPVVDSTSEFNPVTDKIIFSVETITGELLVSEKVSNFNIRNYKNTINEDQISSVVVYPTQDIENSGYSTGVYNVYYNFYRTALKSDQYKFFLQEISPSRTELRLSVNNVSNKEINSLVQEFQSLLEGDAFKDFYIEINGSYYIANNILVDVASVPNTILLKLYQPLPSNIEVNTQLEVVFETAETVGFNINLPPKPIQIEGDVEYIKGPNFSYQLSDQVNNSTIEQDYNSLVGINQITSSYNELENFLNQKGITVNIDYTEFDNFIQFSSAEQRLLNFYYKVGQLEAFNNDLNNLNTITSFSPSVSASKASLESQITDIIRNFDGYENYLYYTSGALAYPKSNSSQPYTLQSTGSGEVLNWLGSANESSPYYGGRLLTASVYDNENQDNLFNTVPTYLREDPANAGYELFLNMIGQHFDILYSYINIITEKNNADNRLDHGISKDLVADALRDAGLKLYQNNFSSDELYSAIIGYNPNGGILPPTGSEVINEYVAVANSAIPLDDFNKETYKRLYHNLPYLLKKKGTVEGLRALVNCFGIPDTILRISEFGGKDKNNTNDYDYTHNRFNYSLYANAVDQVVVPWTSSLFQLTDGGSNGNVPQAIFFRFKTDGYRDSQTQALLVKDSGQKEFPNFHIKLEHTGSGTLTSGSYSGSIQSQSAEYGTLTFQIGNPAASYTASINLPFYNGDWWGVSLIKGRFDYNLRAGQKIYNGQDGWKIGYFDSASTGVLPVNIRNDYWNSTGSVRFSNDVILDSTFNVDTTLFKGYYQEIRYHIGDFNRIEDSVNTITKDYIMNPTSLESIALTGSNSSFNSISFRAPLGNELIGVSSSLFIPPLIFNVGDGLPTSLPFNLPLLNSVINPSTGLPVSLPFSLPLYSTSTHFLTSVHPAISASSDLLVSHSFGDNSTYRIINYDSGQPLGSHLVGDTEFYYFDQPASGVKNRVSEKIKSPDISIATGDTLSPYRSVQQNYPSERNYTKDINYVEVAFSPQNEINDDINSTLGYFNIGEYIGDPRQVSESHYSYSGLDQIRDSYFEKYYKSYDWKDYIRLIKYFDNSLFKMVQDFVPANSGLASGVVIKQHLLERNKQRPTQVETSRHDYTGSIESAFISGGTGGVFSELNVLGSNPEGQSQGFVNQIAPFVTQSWAYGVDTPVGPQIISQSTQDEFYNGEFSGSEHTVTDGELLLPLPIINIEESEGPYTTVRGFDRASTFTAVNSSDGAPISNNGFFQIFWPYFVINESDNEVRNPNSIPEQLVFRNKDSNGDDNTAYFNLLNYGDTISLRQVNIGGSPAPAGGTDDGMIHQFIISTKNIITSDSDPTIKWYVFSVLDYIPSTNPSSLVTALLNAFNAAPGGQYLISDMDFQLIVDPSTLQLEANNYANPIFNNAIESRPSSIYQDVDYSTGVISPTNFDLLISNNATLATIPDSNYTQTGWTNGRYNGSRNSSIDFNQ